MTDNATEWVDWVEPFGPKNEPVYCRVTKDVAIATAHDIAAKSGHKYLNDEEALADFMVVHWAQLIITNQL